MFEDADAALAQRDPALPGLALLLDADAIGSAINAALPLARLQQFEKIYLRYKPGMNCLAAYRAMHAGQSVLLHAKAHGPDAEIKLDKAEVRTQVGVGELPGRVVLAEQHVVVSFFPNDSKLKRLRRLGDATKLRSLLARLFPDEPQFWEGSLSTLAYKPERRYVCRLTASNGDQRVLRFHTPSGYAALTVPPELTRLRDGPRFSGRLNADPELGVVVHEWIEGALLRSAYCAEERGEGDTAGLHWYADFVRRTGHALARMHAGTDAVVPGVLALVDASHTGVSVRTLKDEFNVIAACRQGLAFLTPHALAEADSLAERLRLLLQQRTATQALIHGDFYGKQVLDTDQGVAFLDLDEVCLGHPAADLGLFMAHLELEAMYGWLSPGRAGAVSAALLHGYRQGGGHVSPVDLATYTALGLFQLAHHPFRSGGMAWPARIDDLLKICTRYVGQAERGQYGMASAALSGVVDAALPTLVAALDREHMATVLQTKLVEVGKLPQGYQLCHCRLIRHKPGRRALIEYTWSGPLGETRKMLGKLRAKGLDRRTFAAMSALHEHIFKGELEAVPAAIAQLPELDMWLQDWVPGVPAWSLLQGERGGYWGARIAESIHRLHGSGYETDKRHELADEMNILCTRLDLMLASHAELSERIVAVKAACLSLAASLPNRPCVAIHRDFYPDQVLIDGEQVYLLDFDLLCMGDPCIDIGNFIAHLVEHGLRVYGDAGAYADVIASMKQRYVELSPVEDMARDIEVHTVLSLARHIHLCTQFPERTAFTERLLAHCESLLHDVRNYESASPKPGVPLHA